MVLRNAVIGFVIMLSGVISQAQDVEFVASTTSDVRVGEQFRLTYTLNTSGKKFTPPDFSAFRVLSGPNPSSSTSVQIINGQVSRAATTTYTYYLQAIQEGEFTLAPATIIVDGNIYSSNTLKVRVAKGGTAAPPSQGNRPSQGSQNDDSGNLSGEDVFVRVTADNKNPFQGEQVILSYRIYTRVPISQYGFDQVPTYNGFWAQDLLDENQKPSQYNETINGEQYVVAEIKRVALFPLKSGTLTIDPIEVQALAQVQSRTRRNIDPFFDHFFNDPFFGGTVQNIQQVLKSNPVTITVKSLPLTNRPADYTGAVGQFQFKSNIDRTMVKANDAMNLKFTIIGKGNIKMLENPEVVFPPDFEVYDPKVSNDINKNAGGISGARTIEYLIIPRNPGSYVIKAVPFSWFDPDKNDYVTAMAPECTINVGKGEGTSAGIAYSGVSQSDIKYIGSDILHIKTHAYNLQRAGSFFFGSTLYFIILLGAVALAIIFLILWKFQMKRSSDVSGVRTRKATRIARKRLQKASLYLKALDENNFYTEVSQALWGYLSDKFNIALSDLSMESVKQALENKGVREDITQQFMETLDHCEYARFAPGDKSANMDNIYNEALEVISRTERELK